MNSKFFNRATASLLIVEGLLMAVPMIVLGAAINWPASLDEPAAVVLQAIFEEADAVRLGYLGYLIYSLLFFPVIAFVVQIVLGEEKGNSLARMALGFGAISTFARCIGIIRWLVAMPALAVVYNSAGTSPESQEMIGLLFDLLNNFAGAVGEVLGVSIFAAIAMTSLGILILQEKTLPQWIAYFALVVALILLVPSIEIFGLDAGIFLPLSVAVLQIWFLLLGIYLFLAKAKN